MKQTEESTLLDICYNLVHVLFLIRIYHLLFPWSPSLVGHELIPENKNSENLLFISHCVQLSAWHRLGKSLLKGGGRREKRKRGREQGIKE